METQEVLPKAEIKVIKKGRHKKECPCAKCVNKYGEVEERKSTVKKETKPNESKTKGFDDALNEFNSNKPIITEKPKTEENNENGSEERKDFNSSQISGVMMLTIIDILAPFLLLKIFGFFDQKYKKVDTAKVRLTLKEKQDLEEISDLVAREYINMNPIVLLSICLGSLYVGKIQSEV